MPTFSKRIYFTFFAVLVLFVFFLLRSRTTDAESTVLVSATATVNMAGVGDARAVAISGNHAFTGSAIQTGAAPEFRVFDISRTSAPVPLGTLDVGATINDIAVVGDRAYVATSKDSSEIRIIDISNPNAPVDVGGYNISGATNAYAVAIYNQYLYVGAANGQILAFSLANPNALTLVASVSTGSAVNDLVVRKGGVLYAATSNNTKEVIAFNVSQPNSIQEVAVYNIAETVNAQGVEYTDHKVYVATSRVVGKPNFYVFDAAATSSLSFIGAADLLSNNTSVRAYKDFAFVAGKTVPYTFSVVDITNPTVPIKVGSYNTGGAANALAMRAGYAYVASSNNNAELQILDTHYFENKTHIQDVSGDGVIHISCIGDSNSDGLGRPSWCNEIRTNIAQSGKTWETKNRALFWSTVVNREVGPFFADAQMDLAFASDSPDVFVAAFGTNDIAVGFTNDQVVDAYQHVTDRAASRSMPMLIALTPPIGGTDATDAVTNRKVVDQNEALLKSFPRSRLVDFYTPMVYAEDYLSGDKVHINLSGQLKRAQAVFSKLAD